MTEATSPLRPSYRETVAARRGTPLIVAHRGAWTLTCENTVAAITEAAKAGYDIVEIDVRQTADGALVLFHDDDLLRMAGVETTDRGALTLAELRAIPLRPADGRGDQMPGEWRVATLGEALDAARGRIFLDLDLKHLDLMKAVAPLVSVRGMTGQVDVKVPVATEDDVALLHVLEQRHGIMVMPKIKIGAATVEQRLELLRRTGAVLCETSFDRLSTLASHREALAGLGVTIWVNTLDAVSCDGLSDSAAAADPDAIWGKMVEAGVGAFQTDIPDRVKAWRAGRS